MQNILMASCILASDPSTPKAPSKRHNQQSIPVPDPHNPQPRVCVCALVKRQKVSYIYHMELTEQQYREYLVESGLVAEFCRHGHIDPSDDPLVDLFIRGSYRLLTEGNRFLPVDEYPRYLAQHPPPYTSPYTDLVCAYMQHVLSHTEAPV